MAKDLRPNDKLSKLSVPSESPAEARVSEGFWSRLKLLLTGRPENSLRESIEQAIDRHDTDVSEDKHSEARSMMVNLLDFADTRIEDVMVPRADVVAIDETATLQQLLQRFAEANHSRLPVYRETLDNLTGMIHIKDFVSWIVRNSTPRSHRKQSKTLETDAVVARSSTFRFAGLKKTIKQANIVREMLYVPPSMLASDLFVRMQANHIHMAIVVDEYGGTDGLVSIEDLVEIIVGDIADEHDTSEGLIHETGNGSYVADARVPINDVEMLLSVPLLSDDDEEAADTLGGLIFAMLGRVPSRGEIVRHPSGIEFEITESDPRRLKKIRIQVPVKSGSPAHEPDNNP